MSESQNAMGVCRYIVQNLLFIKNQVLKLNPTFTWETVILTTPKTSLFSDSHGF